MTTFTRWILAHKLLIVPFWIVVTIIGLASASPANNALSKQFTAPGGEGITTSAVGANRVLHFTVGTKSYTYTLPASADLSDFNGNAQAIGNNMSVKVKVQVPSNTVVSVGNASGGGNG